MTSATEIQRIISCNPEALDGFWPPEHSRVDEWLDDFRGSLSFFILPHWLVRAFAVEFGAPLKDVIPSLRLMKQALKCLAQLHIHLRPNYGNRFFIDVAVLERVDQLQLPFGLVLIHKIAAA